MRGGRLYVCICDRLALEAHLFTLHRDRLLHVLRHDVLSQSSLTFLSRGLTDPLNRHKAQPLPAELAHHLGPSCAVVYLAERGHSRQSFSFNRALLQSEMRPI